MLILFSEEMRPQKIESPSGKKQKIPHYLPQNNNKQENQTKLPKKIVVINMYLLNGAGEWDDKTTLEFHSAAESKMKSEIFPFAGSPEERYNNRKKWLFSCPYSVISQQVQEERIIHIIPFFSLSL